MKTTFVIKILSLAIYIIVSGMILASCKTETNEDIIKPEPVTKYIFQSPGSWILSSVPATLPEASLTNDLMIGMNRARLAWYLIDSVIFYDKYSPLHPVNISNNELSKHTVRQVLLQEVFPERKTANSPIIRLRIFNLAFYPDEKGPYNFDTYPSGYSEGIDEQGYLNVPESRWGGIVTEIPPQEFTYNYIDFWLMDPLCYDAGITGVIYIDIGTFSEDILCDNRFFSECEVNLSTVQNNDTSIWGLVPDTLTGMLAFEESLNQDVGLDGLKDESERLFYQDYLNDVQSICSNEVFQSVYADPANDNFHGYTGSDYDNDYTYSSIEARYKAYNNLEGNTNPEVVGILNTGYYTGATGVPDHEDYSDYSIFSTENSYFEYSVKISQNDLSAENTYYLEEIYESAGIQLANGETGLIEWYHFKIPIEDFEKKIGNPSIDGSLNNIRIYLKGFNKTVVLRFAEFSISKD